MQNLFDVLSCQMSYFIKRLPNMLLKCDENLEIIM